MFQKRYPVIMPGLIGILLIVSSACSSTSDAVNGGEPTDECTLTNPLAWGQDPWVVRKGDTYYLVQSENNAIWVYRSKTLAEMKTNGVRVWQPPATGWNRSNIWAPELHFIDGKWYIYYTAGESGPPFIHQRSGVLEALTDDPQGAYVDRGRLNTGQDSLDAGDTIWAIDLTVERIDGRLMAVWSGWDRNASTDKTPQYLFAASMANPVTINSERVKLSSPEEDWEVGTELDLNEGPQFLRHDEQVFIIYSTRESWLKEYRLGQLRLDGSKRNPLDPTSWYKSGPVFAGTSTVHGAGHASFISSPDSTEHWIIYHSKTSTDPGWERVIRAQKFTWNVDGSPNFGQPVASGEKIEVPSGECNRVNP